MLPLQLAPLWLLLLAITRAQAQLVQDTRAQTTSELEVLLFDDNPAGFFSGLKPCTAYVDSTTGGTFRNDTGRQTSAQWIRTAFRKLNPASSFRKSNMLETHWKKRLNSASY